MAPRRRPAAEVDDAARAVANPGLGSPEKNSNHPLVKDKGLQKEEKPRGKGKKGKDKGVVAASIVTSPNVPDYNALVLTDKYRVSDQSINHANEAFIDHMNQIRICRNKFIETFTSTVKKVRGAALRQHVDEFYRLKNEIPDKVAAVTRLGGVPAPYPLHLETIPKLQG